MFSKLGERLSYGWVVVSAFFIVNTTLVGIRLTFGVFFKSLESEFSLSRATTSAVFSASMVLGAVFATLGGWALDRYGPRIVVLLMGVFTGLSLFLTSQVNSPWQLFITYSLLLSMGTSAVYVVIMSTVSRWFPKRQGRALGITGSGSGMGSVVFAPLATFLISIFNWRMAYIIIGAIAWLIVIPSSRLLKRAPSEIEALSDETKPSPTATSRKKPESEGGRIQSADLSLLPALRTGNFWLLLFIWVFHGFTTFLVGTHIVPHATDIGIPAVEAATILSVQGGASIIGGVLMGLASDRIGSKLSVIIVALLRTAAMVWLLFAQDLWMLHLFALVFGFATGGLAICTAALIGDAFGLRKLGAIMGILAIGFTTGSAIGPAIGGLIFDVTNSYFSAFLLGAVATLLVAVLTHAIRRETVKIS